MTSNSWVTCTTCHDQHDMLYFNTAAGATVIKPTHFFVRGWYDPGNSATSNSAAQFCRSCHGGESNEMHGQSCRQPKAIPSGRAWPSPGNLAFCALVQLPGTAEGRLGRNLSGFVVGVERATKPEKFASPSRGARAS